MAYRMQNASNQRVPQEFAEQDNARVEDILNRASAAFRDNWSRAQTSQ
jgi:hypothetical protein